MPTSEAGSLAGLGILVTRPAERGGGLADLVRAQGGNAILLPGVEIEPLPASTVAAALERFGTFDYAIFISPSAARLAMTHLADTGGLPPAVRVAAPGPGTAAELSKFGLREVIVPCAGFDSEALLGALPLTEMAGRRVAIFRGSGGRDLLATILRDHGAEVAYIDCYRRVRPDRDFETLLPLWRSGSLHACVATSSEIVENLFAMAGDAGRPWLCDTPIFVSHSRVAAAAFSAGARTVFVAGAGDEALARGLAAWFGRMRPAVTGSPS